MSDFLVCVRRLSVRAVLLPVWIACVLQADANPTIPVNTVPTGGNVTQGSATFSSSGNAFNINQTSANAFINWQSFNVGASAVVNFNQPSASSVTVNQINQGNASQILGDINAPGYVVLENANGFYIGGGATLTTHGLVLTTAATPALNLSSGGPWSFDAPPPSATIQNFGKIVTASGGSAYLIAADIVNNGTITAPNGHIGLYDGETVLVSMTPNAQGLNAQVTLPQGSVDNEGTLTANGGSVVADAQFVNQNGIIQATTAANVNGTIELLGSRSVTLGANSAISATGDPNATSASAGGSIQIQAGSSFSDASGSSINVSGGASTYGGNAGSISISAPQMTALNSTLNGQAAAGYQNGTLSINTADITLNSDGSPAASGLALNVNALSSGFSQINLQASDDITLNANTPWTLAVNGGVTSSVSLQAGNTINLGTGSKIEADGGNITVNAPTVNLAGTVQADSVGSANGVVEIDASLDLNFESGSAINAEGDSTAATASPGGFVLLNAGAAYSDASTSTINVSGAAGGQGGIVEIFDPQVGPTSPIQAGVSGTFAYLVNPFDLTLSATATASSSNPNFNVSDLAAYTQIDLHALDNIEIQTAWTLNKPSSGLQAVLSLTAGNDIKADDGSDISAGKNWTLNLTAGTGQLAPASSYDGIYLDGAAYILAVNGNINLWAANEVQVGWSDNNTPASPGTANSGTGSINTSGGGNINVTTLDGDVNTGSGTGGFIYTSKAPYYRLNGLGGISTAAGGNVNITAGGNVISYTPSPNDSPLGADPGTGAFGTQPGNVTITAGGSVYGHYVLANGVGTITAENGNVGTDPTGTGNQFALSLINGTWFVNAPKGNIYLTEVRNPNALYNNAQGTLGHPPASFQYLFTYSADDAVDLTAGNGVYLTDSDLPRLNSANLPFEVVYPSILDITAGAGGITLEGDVTLYPSIYQNLQIITTDGGNFTTTSAGNYLLMSDSSFKSYYKANPGIFTPSDTGTVLPTEYQPAIINISGDMGGPLLTDPGVQLFTSKETELTVGGDLINCQYSGQNLSVNDVTSFNVTGKIYNTSAYSFVNGVAIPAIPAGDFPLGFGSTWDAIFILAVNPANLNPAYLQSLLNQTPALTPAEIFDDILGQGTLFGAQLLNGVWSNPNSSNPNSYFVYDPATGKLGFGGTMSQTEENELTSGSLAVLHLVNGEPVIDENRNDNSAGRTYGQIEYDTVNWAPASDVTKLYTDSQGAPSPNSPLFGYVLGGPGQFDVTASSIALGNSYGIITCGAIPSFGQGFFGDLTSLTPSGASINVTVTGPDTAQGASLNMLTSAIAAYAGGDVSVISEQGSMDLGIQAQGLGGSTQGAGLGVYTSGGGNVNVIAEGDVDINGSRIASYNGGNIFVESLTGNVNVGSGGNTLNHVTVAYIDPGAGLSSDFSENPFGSGIVADTLVPAADGNGNWPPNPATAPGNITVETPQGSIISTAAGILQESLTGSLPPGPTVTLTAGTFASGTPGQPGYVAPHTGNIELGDSGVIGGTVNLSANGNITGQIVSSQNTTVNAAQSFSGTVLAAGSANVTGGGTISGTIIGVGGATVTGAGGVTASVLGQNVSVNGGAAQSTLGASAAATASTQAASQQASSQSQQQASADQSDQQDDKKKKNTQIRTIGRVTVILASAH